MAKINLEKLLLALDKVMPNGDLMRFNLASALAILGTSFEEIRGNQEKISPFEANIQPGDKIVFNEDMGCRVNLSQLNRVAKPSDPEWSGKIGSKHAEGKLKEMLDKRQEQSPCDTCPYGSGGCGLTCSDFQKYKERQDNSEKLTELESEITHILVYVSNEPTETEEDIEKAYQKYSKNAKFFAPMVLEKARKQIVKEILTKRDIDTYIAQVKNAREAIPYSHQTLIWNVLADLEDDLMGLKRMKEQ